MAVQWEECCGEYTSKRALYFRLHQEMQDTNIKMKGLQQVRLRALNSFCICTIFNGTFAFPGLSTVTPIVIDGSSENPQS